jgi:threonine/homoserine/homoserine lactone efflux protein
MSLSVSLLSIAGALTLGTISPGPSFVMVARTSVTQSRSHGLSAALGMGIGGTLFAVAALFGLQALLSAVPGLHVIMKTAGGAYLAYLGFRIWKGAREDIVSSGGDTLPEKKRAHSFGLALATQLSNPKTAIVYASVFAALLPPELPGFVLVAVPVVVFAIEAGWYALVAVGLSASAPRSAYLRYKTWIDRAAGSVMAILGIKLLFSAVDN